MMMTMTMMKWCLELEKVCLLFFSSSVDRCFVNLQFSLGFG